LLTCLPDWVILGSSEILAESSESESPPNFDITSDSSVLSLSSSWTLFLFEPALALGLAAAFPFPPLADPPAREGVELGLALAFPPEDPALLAAVPALALPPAFPTGVLGISIFIDVFMPISTLRLISSYPGGVPVMPIEVRFEDPAPELMRFKIISVAAENWGTYLGGESVIGVSALLGAGGDFGGLFSIVKSWVGGWKNWIEVCAGVH
jgi:hypothetical protein